MGKSIIDIVSDYIGYDKKSALDMSKKAPSTYRCYSIPKRKGGYRIIHHPSKQTKSLQYALIETLLSLMPVHECAMAYRRGIKSPIRSNAIKHVGFSYSLRVDFKDFFHSIRPVDLLKIIEENMIDTIEKLTPEDKDFIAKSLFVKLPNGLTGLAIGAPSSPIISNIVMFQIDELLNKFARKEDSIYTRYADDIVFSTREKGLCKIFYDELCNIIGTIEYPKLEINKDKTIFTSKGTRRVITGIYLSPDGNISIGRNSKRYIKKLIFDYKNAKLDKKDIAYLQGYLAFILDVEPSFYNNLALKYGGEIVKKALKSKIT